MFITNIEHKILPSRSNINIDSKTNRKLAQHFSYLMLFDTTFMKCSNNFFLHYKNVNFSGIIMISIMNNGTSNNIHLVVASTSTPTFSINKKTLKRFNFNKQWLSQNYWTCITQYCKIFTGKV